MKLHWVVYALMTVVTWGVYGAFLNKGAIGFGHDRIKAFLFVGVAYFLVAVLAPLAYIAIYKTGFDFGKFPNGIVWSLIAGTMGAAGALTVLFALSNNPEKGPIAASQVMALVFAGAPIVAAVYGLILKYQDGTLKSINPLFIVGLLLGASGGALVTLFKP
ncbi:MAG TPA: hypothetical protein VKX17_11085 [Planctomycetota bacterium]|nr:hypothetical protein [Planctomycetota bacterium]